MSDSRFPIREEKLFNDCVHGHFTLPPLCVVIIDTNIFQRLRNIKQLGFGYHVYPGASHNRFEHSLGVCHLAGEISDRLNSSCSEKELQISPIEKLCLQVAGLCHDLGHGPFSHSWERFLFSVNGEASWKHEEMSVYMFDTILENEKVRTEFSANGLGEEHRNLIKNLILGKKDETSDRDFLFEIINNSETGIDVDKWDYLLRDGKQLNINVTFDPHRLLKCLKIAKVNGKHHICYREKERKTIVHMFMMRAELHRMAYQHPVVKMIEQMWIDAMTEANSQDYLFRGVKLSEVHNNPYLFSLLTDHVFQDILYSENEKYLEAKNMLERINTRNLYKVIFRTTLTSQEELSKINNLIEGKFTDLFITSFKAEMPDLEKTVFLYDKENLNEAKLESDWSSVPIFPFKMTEMKRFEVFCYCKKPESLTSSYVNKLHEEIKEIFSKNGMASLNCRKRKITCSEYTLY